MDLCQQCFLIVEQVSSALYSKLIIYIMNNMKTEHNKHFQSDSISTESRQKKFNRKNDCSSNGSRSSRSKSKQFSRFFIKNLKVNQRPEKIDEIVNKSISNKSINWTPPKRQATPSKTDLQRRITFTKQQLIQSQRKQIQNLRQQISKYRNYCNQQQNKMVQIKKQNKQIKAQFVDLQKRIEQQHNSNQQLNKKIVQLTETLSQKQTVIDYYQKEQPGLRKLKTSIFQTRITEFEKQKQQLTKKIRQLQLCLSMDDLRKNQSTGLIQFSLKQINQEKYPKTNQAFIFSSSQHFGKLQQQLYQAKQEIKRLQISQICTKRKCFQQVQKIKASRQKQYEDLKNRFRQFLSKYKTTMKKVFSFQTKNAISKQKQKDKLEAQISLTLSQDQQYK